jgi:class 3 adenylate cyclase
MSSEEAEFLEHYSRYLPLCVIDHVHGCQTVDRPALYQFPAVTAFVDISGFTKLSETLVEKFSENGAEKLNQYISTYFNRLTSVILKWGGDIVKFAGDAMLVVWRSPSIELRTLAAYAIACNLQLIEEFNNFKSEDVTLQLHSSIGSGSLLEFFVGGFQNMWEYFVAGGPIKDMAAAGEHAKTGELVVSESTYQLTKSIINDCKIIHGTGNVRVFKMSEIAPPNRAELPKLSPQEIEILLRFIPPLVRSIASHQVIGEYRRAYVMFVKLVGFEYENSDAVLNFLQKAVDVVQASISMYEGTIARLLADDKGTRFKICFGLPGQVHENDATRIILAAIELEERLKLMKAKCVIGIAQGRLFCGEAGSSIRCEYTAVGFKVNLAARIMSVAEKMDKGVLCDESTYSIAKSSGIEFTPLPDKVLVKGVSAPIQLYVPIGKKDLRSSGNLRSKESSEKKSKQSSVSPNSRGSIPLRASSSYQKEIDVFGRDEEINLFKRLMDEIATNHKPKVIIVEGPSGIGKSHLIQKLSSACMAKSFLTMHTRASWSETSLSFSVWKSIFRQVLDLGSKSDQEVQRILINNLGDEASMAPLLNSVFDTSIPETDFSLEISPDGRTDKIRKLLLIIISKLSQAKRISIFLDDMHWADSASWSLTFDMCSVSNLLIVISMRPFEKDIPSEYSSIKSLPCVSYRQLKPLDLESITKLVSKKLGVSHIPSDILQLIKQRTEGHPLYVEELSQSLLDQGYIRVDHEESACFLSKIAVESGLSSLPNTIHQAFSSRIDHLNPKIQMTLKVCSVIGTMIDAELVLRVHPYFHFKARSDSYGSDSEKNFDQDEDQKIVEGNLLSLVDSGFLVVNASDYSNSKTKNVYNFSVISIFLCVY